MAIPTLDLQLAESDRGEAARQLVSALEDPGFLYLKNVKGYQPGQWRCRVYLHYSWYPTWKAHATGAVL